MKANKKKIGLMNLIMTAVRSKRRVLPLIFIVKSFTKSLLTRYYNIIKTHVGGRVQTPPCPPCNTF